MEPQTDLDGDDVVYELADAPEEDSLETKVNEILGLLNQSSNERRRSDLIHDFELMLIRLRPSSTQNYYCKGWTIKINIWLFSFLFLGTVIYIATLLYKTHECN
jgi:hypothetical protein